MELFGEHSVSVRDQGPAEGARTISGKAPPMPKYGLASVSGSIRLSDRDTSPALPGTGPPF
jgi:hypothetical protein